MNRVAISLLVVFFVISGRAASPIVLYDTGWERAPASPAWAAGNVSSQNGWTNFGGASGHQVVTNGSLDALADTQAVVTPYGLQFEKMLATSNSTTLFAYRDLTAAVAGLPADYRLVTASMDIFVPSTQDGVPGLYGFAARHGQGVHPWGVLVDPSDHSVNVYVDGIVFNSVAGAFQTNTWFNLRLHANYVTGQISVELNGVDIPELTQTSTQISSGALTDVDLVASNYDPTAPPLRVAFSDNFRVIAESVGPASPTLRIVQNPTLDLTLSWEAAFSNWNLESAGAVNGPWGVKAPGPSPVTGGMASVTVTNGPSNSFFRLHKP